MNFPPTKDSLLSTTPLMDAQNIQANKLPAVSSLSDGKKNACNKDITVSALKDQVCGKTPPGDLSDMRQHVEESSTHVGGESCDPKIQSNNGSNLKIQESLQNIKNLALATTSSNTNIQPFLPPAGLLNNGPALGGGGNSMLQALQGETLSEYSDEEEDCERDKPAGSQAAEGLDRRQNIGYDEDGACINGHQKLKQGQTYDSQLNNGQANPDNNGSNKNLTEQSQRQTGLNNNANWSHQQLPFANLISMPPSNAVQRTLAESGNFSNQGSNPYQQHTQPDKQGHAQYPYQGGKPVWHGKPNYMQDHHQVGNSYPGLMNSARVQSYQQTSSTTASTAALPTTIQGSVNYHKNFQASQNNNKQANQNPITDKTSNLTDRQQAGVIDSSQNVHAVYIDQHRSGLYPKYPQLQGDHDMSLCSTSVAGTYQPQQDDGNIRPVGMVALIQKPTSQTTSKDSQINQGRWSKNEHIRFLEALKLYGKNWKNVQNHVQSRTSTQARSHAQKFFVKLDRKKMDLQEFLDSLDMNNLQNLAPELLEYEDDDEGPTPPANQGGATPIDTPPTHLGKKRPSPSQSQGSAAELRDFQRQKTTSTSVGLSKFKSAPSDSKVLKQEDSQTALGQNKDLFKTESSIQQKSNTKQSTGFSSILGQAAAQLMENKNQSSYNQLSPTSGKPKPQVGTIFATNRNVPQAPPKLTPTQVAAIQNSIKTENQESVPQQESDTQNKDTAHLQATSNLQQSNSAFQKVNHGSNQGIVQPHPQIGQPIPQIQQGLPQQAMHMQPQTMGYPPQQIHSQYYGYPQQMPPGYVMHLPQGMPMPPHHSAIPPPQIHHPSAGAPPPGAYMAPPVINGAQLNHILYNNTIPETDYYKNVLVQQTPIVYTSLDHQNQSISYFATPEAFLGNLKAQSYEQSYGQMVQGQHGGAVVQFVQPGPGFHPMIQSVPHQQPYYMNPYQQQYLPQGHPQQQRPGMSEIVEVGPNGQLIMRDPYQMQMVMNPQTQQGPYQQPVKMVNPLNAQIQISSSEVLNMNANESSIAPNNEIQKNSITQ